jgi:hypothetical protein
MHESCQGPARIYFASSARWRDARRLNSVRTELKGRGTVTGRQAVLWKLPEPWTRLRQRLRRGPPLLGKPRERVARFPTASTGGIMMNRMGPTGGSHGARFAAASGRRASGDARSSKHASSAVARMHQPGAAGSDLPGGCLSQADWLTRGPPTEDAWFGTVERERERALPGDRRRVAADDAAVVTRSAPAALVASARPCDYRVAGTGLDRSL